MTGKIPKLPALLRCCTPAKRLALIAVAALACAGCNVTAKEEISESIPIDHRQRHPIAIRETDRTLEVFVGSRRAGLMDRQRSEIAAFVDEWRGEATGGIIIDVPAGTPNARAAAEAAREMRTLLAASGVPPKAIAMRRYSPADPAQLATVRLHYPKMTAQAGPCGLWPEDLALTKDSQPTLNRPYWNFGCANQRNLAAMVANPADLAQPRGETPIYTARRTKVLEKYRDGDITAGNYPEPRATISEFAR
ncbi:MAG TPA: CpaD family pilus assembly protein [Xanthobacteraceae bacterium]|nr:CpaD family pilus assembly protein [Xanthobacteraceae bacterium]